ncbi:MAG: hypothetical protein M3016_08455 [Actinomycetota bacterium]|nr:hypothetical protein [Actinomycetota bacterium]
MTPTRSGRLLTAAMLAGVLMTGVALIRAATAWGARGQAAIIQDGRILSDPAGYLARFRALGASTVRVVVLWDHVAPQPEARRMPSGFEGGDPDSYPDSGWAPYDRVVTEAARDGITLEFTITGGAPLWAEGARIAPPGASHHFAWKPNARLFGQFVHAVGERYSGRFTPASSSTPLPAVHFWSLWNEPNFGQDLGPQAIDGSSVSVAPGMYRRLLDAGWSALHNTGHGRDKILIGGFAAQGLSHRPSKRFPQGLPGNYGQTKPLKFVHTLYCLDDSYHRLRGRYAQARGCPATAAASRRFRAQNPGLFKAGGVADHPYPGGLSPLGGAHTDPSYAGFPQLGRLERTLDRVNRAYGSRTRYQIYSDEFGYITRPPQTAPYVSPAQAAYYLNWTEYLSWRSPRVASYAQYLLDDPPPTAGQAGFASGLLTASDHPKATYYAYRLPLFLPRTALRRGKAGVVWGDVRPARFMQLDTGATQTVQIQLQAHRRGRFRTLRTVPVTDPRGYLYLRMAFPESGNARLAYTYPAADALLPLHLLGTTVYSRIVRLDVR